MQIFIIDKHVLFRRCIVSCLEEMNDITVIGQAEAIEEALKKLKLLSGECFTVLVDLDITSHIDKTELEKILKLATNCSVVLISDSFEPADIYMSIRLGVKACLCKNIELEEFCEELFRIENGEPVFPQGLLVDSIRSKGSDKDKPSGAEETKVIYDEKITRRESEILQLVADGLMDKQIAANLEISENTVKNHVKSIRQKLHATNRLQASMKGIQLGIIKINHTDQKQSRVNVLKEPRLVEKFIISEKNSTNIF